MGIRLLEWAFFSLLFFSLSPSISLCTISSAIQVPHLFFSIQKTPADWQFRTQTKRACRAYDDGCLWPRGKMLGGTSALNGMLYIRGNQRDYDEWERFGNPTWNWKNVLEYFRKSEDNQNASLIGAYHSAGGLLKVDKLNANDRLAKIVLSAAEEIGRPILDDLNGDTLLGYGYTQTTVHNGQRQSAAKAFLVPAKNRPNLHVIKHAHATKIHINDKGLAHGIEFTYRGSEKFVAKSTKEIIVSAGAVSSPQLLMLSGIGPEKHLRKLNISIKKNLAVGKNLQDHLIVPMFFGFHKSNVDDMVREDLAHAMYEYVLQRNGAFASIGATDLCGFVNTVNHTGHPDIETHHFSFAKQTNALATYLRIVGYIDRIRSVLFDANKNQDLLTVYVVLLNPKSTGKIKLKSSDANDAPLIQPNYLHKKEDMDTLVRGVKYQHSFINTKAFAAHEGNFIRLPFDDCDRFAIDTDDYWRCYILNMGTTVYHPAGTAKMGPATDRHAVVDSRLRVHDVQGLRVIDASIMPKLVSGNTNAPTIMIGEKGADFIKEDWKNDSVKDEL